MITDCNIKQSLLSINDNLENATILCDLLIDIINYTKKCCSSEKSEIIEFINNLLISKEIEPQIKILIYSSLMGMSDDSIYPLVLLDVVDSIDDMSWGDLYFISSQISSHQFLAPDSNIDEITTRNWKLLRRSLNAFIKQTDIDLTPIPVSELNGTTQIIITDQFLTTEHGPTKTTLDRADVISKYYNGCFIINTAESMTRVTTTTFISKRKAHYLQEFTEYKTVQWKGPEHLFFQCEQDMPNEDVIRMLIDVIRKLKPKICVNVGGNSFFAGVVNEIIPVLTVATTQSSIVPVLTDFQVADVNQINLHKDMLQKMNYESNIIEGKFTFLIKENQNTVTNKADLGISENNFVIALVGSRLKQEASPEFWETLESFASPNLVICVIGKYDDAASLINKYKNLRIIPLGECEDVISILSVADLYVNPLRSGGATSAVEAMSVGKPVLTVDYGDVAGTVGPEFCVESLNQYPAIINRYMTDKEFYISQSVLAKEKARVLLDSETEFHRIVEEYLRRR